MICFSAIKDVLLLGYHFSVAGVRTLLRLTNVIVILVYYNTMERAKINKEVKLYALRREA
jgi:hypothetical protein